MDRNYAYFSFIGSGDTQLLTEHLGLEPTSAWNKGDLRKHGKSRYDFSRWSFESDKFEQECLDDALIAVLDFIDDNQLELRKLPVDFKAHLQCVGYHEKNSPGFHLDADTITRLGQLGLSVDFDLYCHAGE